MYVAKSGQSLLGWPHQEEVGIRLDPRADPLVYTIGTPQMSRGNSAGVGTGGVSDFVQELKQQFPDVFNDKLGEYQGI